jgi:hypothetical protein
MVYAGAYTDNKWEDIGARTLTILPVSSSLPDGAKNVKVLQRNHDGTWYACWVRDREVIPVDDETTEAWVRDYYGRA